jgi:hypothetical protein
MWKSRNLFALAASTFLAVSSLATPLHAAVIDTFAFTFPGNWFTAPSSQIAFGGVHGSFTGTVEPDNTIQLSDLTSFSLTVAGMDSTSPGILTLFSFNTAGGVSSLDFIANSGFGIVCGGAAATLSLA